MLSSSAKNYTTEHLLGYREMLEESVSDLRSTMCELQERLHSVDGEGKLTFMCFLFFLEFIIYNIYIHIGLMLSITLK